MGPELFDIQDWFDGLSCAPTALAAISGRPLAEIGLLLQQAANANGHEISERLLANYNLSDTLKAIKLLGCFWFEADQYDDRAFDARPSIDLWMATAHFSGIKLIFCDDGGVDGHIFAAKQGMVVDTYTNGHCVVFSAVPAAYRKFRVKLTFLVLVGAQSGRR
jgi:hypothetical protein